jgi:hypothetical protein
MVSTRRALMESSTSGERPSYAEWIAAELVIKPPSAVAYGLAASSPCLKAECNHHYAVDRHEATLELY